jgi:lysophospholipid acyltransferase (LPLAT)-like uncharacterized protein
MQGFISWVVDTYLVATLRTTRWTLHGAANFSPFARGDVVIAALWHERLALTPMLWLTAREMHRRGYLRDTLTAHHGAHAAARFIVPELTAGCPRKRWSPTHGRDARPL